ncbi:hypothetical protein H2203_009271 [Taxawa tesnikishii (nom. ined.)]|nr:hypothetical protein H2203_009271 [Dothideales sp. JES 119]
MTAMTVNMTMTKRKMSDLLEPKQQRRVKLWKEMREEEADILIATLQKNDPVVSVCFDSSANMTSSKAPTSRDLNKKAYNQANLGGGAVRQNGLLGQHIPLQQQPLRNRLRDYGNGVPDPDVKELLTLLAISARGKTEGREPANAGEGTAAVLELTKRLFRQGPVHV